MEYNPFELDPGIRKGLNQPFVRGERQSHGGCSRQARVDKPGTGPELHLNVASIHPPCVSALNLRIRRSAVMCTIHCTGYGGGVVVDTRT